MELEAISRKRKQERMGTDGANKKLWSDNGGIDRLHDDVLINILSHMSLKEAARASVLAHRWRYLWRFSHGTLRFDHRDTANGNVMKRKKFESWVNGVMDVHQGRYIEGMIISFKAGGDKCWISPRTSRAVDNWLYFAMQKEVQRLELNLSLDANKRPSVYTRYVFPRHERLISHSHGVTSPFCRLRTLRLAHVDVSQEDVEYFLESCPGLEELCIHFSFFLTNLRVVDPPSLRVLEINRCPVIRSLEISAVDLVSLTYGGRKNSLQLKKIPNIRELTISDDLCMSFVLEPKEHSSYSVQLEKLVLDFRLQKHAQLIFAPLDLPQLCSLKRLELQVYTDVGRSLDFTSLIKASPHLCEFRIELSYPVELEYHRSPAFTFPGIISMPAAGTFVHRNLKVIEMDGYIGCHCSEGLLLKLIRRCPSIERIVIHIATDYYDDPRLDSYIAFRRSMHRNDNFGATTRKEAEKCTKRFASNIPKRIKFIVT